MHNAQRSSSACLVWSTVLLFVINPLASRGSEPGPATRPGDAVAVWPQWRGPTRDGQVAGSEWPAKLQGDSLTQLWRVELGQGYSSPIVTPDRVFSVETKGDEEIARALDRKTGKELWLARWKGSMRVPFFAAKNGSWVRATPAWRRCSGSQRCNAKARTGTPLPPAMIGTCR